MMPSFRGSAVDVRHTSVSPMYMSARRLNCLPAETTVKFIMMRLKSQLGGVVYRHLICISHFHFTPHTGLATGSKGIKSWTEACLRTNRRKASHSSTQNYAPSALPRSSRSTLHTPAASRYRPIPGLMGLAPAEPPGSIRAGRRSTALKRPARAAAWALALPTTAGTRYIRTVLRANTRRRERRGMASQTVLYLIELLQRTTSTRHLSRLAAEPKGHLLLNVHIRFPNYVLVLLKLRQSPFLDYVSSSVTLLRVLVV